MQTSCSAKPVVHGSSLFGWQVGAGRALGLVLLIVSLSCDALTELTPISAIVHSPDRFVGRQVIIRGSVTKSINLPLLPGIYWIDDGSGELAVVSTSRAPLVSTKRLRVVGKIEWIASVGAIPIGVYAAEIRRQ